MLRIYTEALDRLRVHLNMYLVVMDAISEFISREVPWDMFH